MIPRLLRAYERERRKRACCCILILAWLCLGTASAAGCREMPPPWQGADALEESLPWDKPTLIYLYTPWCYYCKKMVRFVFSSQEVQEGLAAKVRAVAIDLHQKPEFERKYRVTATPTMILLDRQGRERGRLRGYQSVETMLALLAKIPPSK